jgi:F-type H+-transporting ATPase subunit alpha
MKQVAGTLRIELAQYRELAAFSQFGSDLDKEAKERIEKGKRLMEVLKQGQYTPMPVEEQVITLWTVVKNYLKDISVEDINRFEKEFLEYIDTHYRDLRKMILKKKEIDKEVEQGLNEAITEFRSIFKH